MRKSSQVKSSQVKPAYMREALAALAASESHELEPAPPSQLPVRLRPPLPLAATVGLRAAEEEWAAKAAEMPLT
jgi:hypothetical protein